MDVIGSYNGEEKTLIINNESQGVNISMENVSGYKCDITVNMADLGEFVDPVEVKLEAIEIFADNISGDP